MIFVLTGPVHSGKTTVLKKVVYELKEQNVKIDGFLSEAIWKNQEAMGYDLFDLKEERSIPYIRRRGEKGWQKIGSYFFIPQSLAEARKIILRGKDADILVVDEVGPLEFAGKGLWPTLEQVIFQPTTSYLLIVRENILEDFLKILGNSEAKVFDIRNKEIFPQMIEEIKRAV